ncbi:MAG: EamA family transporter [bacterium]
MSFLAVVIIALSGLLHALWSFLIKKSHHKVICIWLMFLETSLIMTALYLVYFKRFGFLSPRSMVLAVLTTIGYFLYQVSSGLAYELEDMSLVYPLTMSAPLFVPVWAWTFIGEQITIKGFAGIILSVIAIYLMPLDNLQPKTILKPLSRFKRRGVRLAIFAALVDSISNVINKTGITKSNAFAFTYSIVVSTSVFLGLYCLLRDRQRKKIRETVRLDRKNIFLAGLIFALSFPAYQVGISLAKISYATPTRRISILFGVLLGIVVLKEKHAAKVRIFASLLLIVGIWLMKIG